MDFAYIASTFLRVGAGLGTTLKLFFITILASLPLGFLITLLLRSGITPLRWLAKVFVYLMRSTPLVLQLLFIYFGLPYLPGVGNYFSTMGRFTATIWGFVLNYAAYFAEIFRGGLLAVEAGQYEAAKVLGLTRWQTITRVVFPQMLRVAMPSISNETITLSGGTSAKASDRIDVKVSDGKITFSDKSSAGNSVYISGASGTVATELNLKGVTSSDKVSEIKPGSGSFTKEVNTGEYLSGKAMNVNLDGTTKTIYGPKIVKNEDGTYTFTKASTVKDKNGQSRVVYNKADEVKVDAKDAANKYAEILNEGLNKAFGDKVTVENKGTYDGKEQLRLEFKVKDGSNLLVNTDAGDVLNIGKSATSYLNTNKTLGELMGEDMGGLKANEDGKYDFVLNGEKIGSYDKDTKLADIMSDINSNKGAGVKVSYSPTTNNFLFSASETGSDGDITMGFGLAQVMFGQADSYQFSTNEKVGNLLGTGADYGESGDNATIHFGDNMHLPLRIEAEDSVSDVVQKLNDLIDEIQADVGVANFDYTARFDKTLGTFVLRDNATGEDLAASSGEGVGESLLSAVAASVERSKNSAIDLSGSTKALLGMGTDQNLAGNFVQAEAPL